MGSISKKIETNGYRWAKICDYSQIIVCSIFYLCFRCKTVEPALASLRCMSDAFTMYSLFSTEMCGEGAHVMSSGSSWVRAGLMSSPAFRSILGCLPRSSSSQTLM